LQLNNCTWQDGWCFSDGEGAAGRNGGGLKNKPISKSVKADLQFPVWRLSRYLKKGRYADRVGSGAPVYVAAVLEYLAAEVQF
jgi:histone H2A